MTGLFYLKSLVIQNFATFKNQRIRFKPGFNAIVGETGSGKSLVLDALQLILGGRADKKIVRKETEYSLLEACFHCSDPRIKDFLETEGYPGDNEIIIKRLIYKNGTSKNYINHLSCTVNFLSSFARKFIDVVGQFENQRLLSDTYQLQLLDQFSSLEEKVGEYQNLLQTYRRLMKDQEALICSRKQREQRLDYLNYQLQEIEKLAPSSQEESDLLKQKLAMVNIEKTQRACAQLKEILEGTEGQSGMLASARLLGHLMLKHSEIFADSLNQVAEIEDELHRIDQMIDQRLGFEFDPEDLANVLERLDGYQRLKKKFGGSTESILQAQIEFGQEKLELEASETNLGDLAFKIETLEKELNLRAMEIHEARVRRALDLGKDLTQRIRQLRMQGATIRVSVELVDGFHETGLSRVCFFAETNSGEGFFRIKDIASGGELSRILLAVRQILSQHDSISIFLFDEIDTGIGGETAICIGKGLIEVATTGQVIAITHLPQIAQFAENLILVQKETLTTGARTRTESSIKELEGKSLKREVEAMVQLN